MEEIRDISGLGEEKKHVRKLCLQDRRPLGVWEDIEPLLAENLN